jgi:hypothetical protein
MCVCVCVCVCVSLAGAGMKVEGRAHLFELLAVLGALGFCHLR